MTSTNCDCELRRNKATHTLNENWTLYVQIIRISSYQHTKVPNFTLIQVYKINNQSKVEAIVQQIASTERILLNSVLRASSDFAFKLFTIPSIKSLICHIKQQQTGIWSISMRDDFESPGSI